MQERSVASSIEDTSFAMDKMAIVTGPRQSGKTTLARQLLGRRGRGVYANWDEKNFRRAWARSPLDWVRAVPPGRGRPLVVLDEIHKARLWKRDLKGVYDELRGRTDLLVTGSARLDVVRRGGDSLLGRYFAFRLHPFSVSELTRRSAPSPAGFWQRVEERSTPQAREAVDLLFNFGGFPEPYLRQSGRFLRLWQRSRTDLLIREDLRDLSRLPELGAVETLASLLPDRVASMLSIQSLRRDLEAAHTTVSRWLAFLEVVYYSYTVQPYSRNVARSLRRAPKLYLWDWSEVREPGPRFENMVAGHLLKAVEQWTDSGEGRYELRYLRNKDQEEVDFLVLEDRKPWLAIEAKLQKAEVNPALVKFAHALGLRQAIQVVRQPGVFRWETSRETGVRVLVASADRVLRALV